MGKSKKKHYSRMSKGVWCDFTSEGDFLELHEICYIPRCKCQKQIAFSERL